MSRVCSRREVSLRLVNEELYSHSFYIGVQLAAPVKIYLDVINGKDRVGKLQCRHWCRKRTYVFRICSLGAPYGREGNQGIINLKTFPPVH